MKIPLLWLKVSLVVLFILVSVSFAVFNKTKAASGPTLSGWAWSDTIGWIDMNNVSINKNNGTLSGYAWSDNIGWVSFNPSDVSGCPRTPCPAKVLADGLEGFAKAISGGTAQSGGWDGWIDLASADVLSTGVFTGYAWGSDVVGWVSMALVSGGSMDIDGVAITPQYLSSVPTSLCAVGTASPVTGNGSPATPWTWTCAGTGGGATGVGYAYFQTATVAVIQLSASPTTISKGGNSSLAWNITDTNILCTLIATSTVTTASPTCDATCVSNRIAEANSFTAILNTGNADANYPNVSAGSRSMSNALTTNAPSETKAVGKKTLTGLNYTTDFILHCGAPSDVSAKKVRVNVAGSTES